MSDTELSIRNSMATILRENPNAVFDLGKEGVSTLVKALIDISKKAGELTSEAQLQKRQLEANTYLAALHETLQAEKKSLLITLQAEKDRIYIIDEISKRYSSQISDLIQAITDTTNPIVLTQMNMALKMLLQSKDNEIDHINQAETQNTKKESFIKKLFKKNPVHYDEIVPME